MDRETLEFLSDLETAPQNALSNDAIVPPGQRACPICRQLMQVEVEYGISIDVCNAHGMWLDRGELPGIVSRIRSGERINRHQAIRTARRNGKVSGSIFGVWSLLFD